MVTNVKISDLALGASVAATTLFETERGDGSASERVPASLIRDYINTNFSLGDLPDATVVDSSEGLAAADNDTSFPTTAAVRAELLDRAVNVKKDFGAVGDNS